MTERTLLRLSHAPSPAAPHLWLLGAFVLLLLVLVACGGNDDGDPAEGASGAELACSQECADRGQCGESVDRGTVVLLNLEEPAVAALDHDLAVAVGTPVQVVDQRPVPVVEDATGLEFPVNFYRVLVPQRSVEAWVAGWCVLNAQP